MGVKMGVKSIYGCQMGVKIYEILTDRAGG